MHRRVSIPLGATTLVLLGTLWVPVRAQTQRPPPSALVNQRAEETLETARALSPRTNEEALAYFQDDVDAAVANAIQRVWDPTRPRESSPRTPWGAPDLRGYWLNLGYTPLERPDELAGKPLYTAEEAIEVFRKAVAEDAAVDPATVHYDWKEFGMDHWQSPVRPNRRTALLVDPPDGKIPALTREGQERSEALAQGCRNDARCHGGNHHGRGAPLSDGKGWQFAVPGD